LAKIPDKEYFKIGEVSSITDLKPHVLRYWETEFSILKPQKTRTSQRLYRRRDVELLLQIKQLLYKEGFTIAGANKRLKGLARDEHQALSSEAALRVIEEVRLRMQELLESVDEESEIGR
jgi:DNA-binding transcriptional MerR regulator